MRTFEISQEQEDKIQDWLVETVYPEVIERQKKEFQNPTEFIKMCWEEGYPYTGAIGGGLTYKFSPTGLGIVTEVTYLGYELNLTDYDTW